MGDALCMMMVPPNQEDLNQQQQQGPPSGERSSLRRSLNLSNGAFGLRRFSRSMTTETSTTEPSNTNTSQRRATISSSTRPSTLHVRIVPHIENPSRSLIFDIFDRELQAAVYIKIGRFTDRSQSPTHMSFKTKVVSRAHCEIWMQDGKLFVRDTKSSSGTFLNHMRISPPNQESRPYEIKDGDIVQLGVDYQGGVEEIYRSVKMRFEVNRTRRQRPLSFNMTAFQNIRNLTSGGGGTGTTLAGTQIQEQTASPDSMSLADDDTPPPLPADAPIMVAQAKLELNPELAKDSQVEECCICLYALAPLQALFVSPCAHTYHFKCIRPLLSSYPGFQCPICRTYSDLDANINMESEEVEEKYGLQRQSTIPDPTSALTCTTTITSSHQQDAPTSSSHNMNSIPTTSSQPQPSQEDQDTTPLAYIAGNTQRMLTERPARDRQTVVVEDAPVTQLGSTSSSTDPQPRPPLPWQRGEENDLLMTTSQDRQQRSVLVNDNVMVIPDTNMNETIATSNQQRRRASTPGFVEKLKMVFFEKRKSSAVVVPRERKRTNRPRPLSYPNFLRSRHDDQGDTDDNDIIPPLPPIINNNSSASASHNLSRQSTTHLAEIEEEDDEVPWHQHFNQYQPMSVDS